MRTEATNRFQLIAHPVKFPGKCVVCGYSGGDERKFVDFGFDLDFYGQVLFCTSCYTAGINILGYISPGQANTLFAKLASMEETLEKLKGQNDNLRTALGSLDFVPRRDDSELFPVEESNDGDPGTGKPEPVSNERPTESGRSDTGKTRKTKSASSNGELESLGFTELDSNE